MESDNNYILSKFLDSIPGSINVNKKKRKEEKKKGQRNTNSIQFKKTNNTLNSIKYKLLNNANSPRSCDKYKENHIFSHKTSHRTLHALNSLKRVNDKCQSAPFQEFSKLKFSESSKSNGTRKLKEFFDEYSQTSYLDHSNVTSLQNVNLKNGFYENETLNQCETSFKSFKYINNSTDENLLLLERHQIEHNVSTSKFTLNSHHFKQQSPVNGEMLPSPPLFDDDVLENDSINSPLTSLKKDLDKKWDERKTANLSLSSNETKIKYAQNSSLASSTQVSKLDEFFNTFGKEYNNSLKNSKQQYKTNVININKSKTNYTQTSILTYFKKSKRPHKKPGMVKKESNSIEKKKCFILSTEKKSLNHIEKMNKEKKHNFLKDWQPHSNRTIFKSQRQYTSDNFKYGFSLELPKHNIRKPSLDMWSSDKKLTESSSFSYPDSTSKENVSSEGPMVTRTNSQSNYKIQSNSVIEKIKDSTNKKRKNYFWNGTFSKNVSNSQNSETPHALGSTIERLIKFSESNSSTSVSKTQDEDPQLAFSFMEMDLNDAESSSFSYPDSTSKENVSSESLMFTRTNSQSNYKIQSNSVTEKIKETNKKRKNYFWDDTFSKNVSSSQNSKTPHALGSTIKRLIKFSESSSSTSVSKTQDEDPQLAFSLMEMDLNDADNQPKRHFLNENSNTNSLEYNRKSINIITNQVLHVEPSTNYNNCENIAIKQPILSFAENKTNSIQEQDLKTTNKNNNEQNCVNNEAVFVCPTSSQVNFKSKMENVGSNSVIRSILSDTRNEPNKVTKSAIENGTNYVTIPNGSIRDDINNVISESLSSLPSIVSDVQISSNINNQELEMIDTNLDSRNIYQQNFDLIQISERFKDGTQTQVYEIPSDLTEHLDQGVQSANKVENFQDFTKINSTNSLKSSDFLVLPYEDLNTSTQNSFLHKNSEVFNLSELPQDNNIQLFKRGDSYKLTKDCILYSDNLIKELLEEESRILRSYKKIKKKHKAEETKGQVLAQTYIKRYRNNEYQIFKIKNRSQSKFEKVYQPPEQQFIERFTQEMNDDGTDGSMSDSERPERVSTPASYKTDYTRSETFSTGSLELTEYQQLIRKGINQISKNKSLAFSRYSDVAPEEPNSVTILLRVQELIIQILRDYKQNKDPCFYIPSMGVKNCVFCNERWQLAQPIKRTTKISFKSKSLHSKTRFNLLLFILNKVRILLETGTKLTKREIFYQLKPIISSQRITDTAIATITRMLNVGAWSLNITAQKGLIYGNLKLITGNGQTINCNVPGTLVPLNISDICEIHSDAYFILVVEKESIFNKLLEENLPKRLTRPFILVTGKGFPDLSTQLFLKKLWMILKIPVFILTDADPDGIAIMLNYRFGSIKSAHLSEYLSIPKAKWIGVLPSEVLTMNLTCADLTKRDIHKITSLLKLPCVQQHESIKKELSTLLNNGSKAGIEALMKSEAYLSHRYLSSKFLLNDLI